MPATFPRSIGRTRSLAFVGLFVLLFVALFWRLGDASFWDPDEAHYAQTSRELVERGDWLAPFYNGEPFFDKPIPFYWLQAAPMALGLDPELAARLGPAVAGLLLVLLTAWLGTTLTGATTGMLAALLLATNPGLFGLARYAILDLPFTLCLFGGVSLVAVAMLRGRPSLEWGGYALVGLATAIKGPLALVLCGVTFGLVAAVSPEGRQRLFALRWVRGFLLACAIGAPWPIYMLWRFRGAFVDGYILNENLRLYATPMYGNQPGWWFYLGILAVGMLPWTLLLATRAVDQWTRRRAAVRGHDLFDVLLWCWVAAIVGFFSLSRFKLDHYVFPSAPALCLIVARAWVEWSGAPLRASAALSWGMRTVGPTLVAAGLAVAYAAVVFLDLPGPFMVVPIALVAAGVVTALQTARPGRMVFPAAALAAMGLLYFGAVAWVIPRLEAGKVMPDVAQWVATQAAEGDRVAAFRLNRWNTAYRFYVNRPVLRIESDEDARRFFSDPSPYYCVMTHELYEALRNVGVPLRVAYERDGRWVTSGRALWRTGGKTTTFVVTVPERPAAAH